jgi:hypothetical protein
VKTVMNHKMLGNSLVAERLAASQGLSSMELVNKKKSSANMMEYSLEGWFLLESCWRDRGSPW